MKVDPKCTGVLLVPFALSALAPTVGDKIEFAVESETTVTKSFRDSTEWTLDLLDMVIDGEPIGIDIPDSTGTTERWLTVTDEYVEVEDGVAIELRRNFDSIGQESTFEVEGMGSRRCECASELEEKTVLFTWNGEDYDRRFDGAKGDRELLEGLSADIDLLGFLPKGEVDAGETWDVDTEALARLIAPGGNLALLPSDAEMGNSSEIPAQFVLANALFHMGELAEAFEGNAEATYVGQEEGEAKIVVEFELEAETDHVERFQEYLLERLNDQPIDDLKLELAMDVAGEATLLWNLKEGRFTSAEVETDLSVAISIAWLDPQMSDGTNLALFAADIELGGISEIELTVD